jgi:hypothetical protein
MFDLEYYNEIIAYGRLYEELERECRVKSGHTRPHSHENNTIKKERMTTMAEYYMNTILLFERKHTKSYETWFNNYYNKKTIMDRIASRHTDEMRPIGILKNIDELHNDFF